MRQKSLFTLMLAFLILVPTWITGCEQKVDVSGISNYGEQTITISGLKDREFEVTINEIAQLECVTQSASASRSNGETVNVKATGPLLNTFLKQYGKKQTDFTMVRFTAKDGYSIAIPTDILEQRDIILAVMDNNKALTQDDAPLRAVVPKERAMYWTRMISRIEFETGEASEMCERVILLESAVNNLPQEDYEYYGSVDKIVATRDLLGAFAGIKPDVTRMFFIAEDGLEKSETIENFLDGAIKFTGEDSPKFVSEELPIGMHIRDIVSFHYGNTAFISMRQLQSVLKETGGIHLSSVIRQAGGVNAEGYAFTCQDKTQKEFDLTELGEAYLILDEDQNINLYFGQPNNTVCSGVLSIEAIGAQ